MPIPVMDPNLLVKLANTRMPYGKYSGRLLIDLPDRYLVWYAQKGYPDGELGKLLSLLNTIKEIGLEGLIRPLIKKRQIRLKEIGKKGNSAQSITVMQLRYATRST